MSKSPFNDRSSQDRERPENAENDLACAIREYFLDIERRSLAAFDRGDMRGGLEALASAFDFLNDPVKADDEDQYCTSDDDW